MTDPARDAPPDLLGFAAPGLLHGLGNNLFAVHGHAQMLRGSHDGVAREKDAILEASRKALHALDILRYLIGEPSPEPPPAAGVLLRRLCDTLRVPLHEAGLQVTFTGVSSDAPVLVDGPALCQVVVQVLRALAADVPRGLQRAISVELTTQRADFAVVVFRMTRQPAFLPFPVDVSRAVDRARAVLDRYGATMEGMDDEQALRLRLPVGRRAAREVCVQAARPERLSDQL